MNHISKYSKFVPYLYFIAVIIYWFTDVNRHEGIAAFPILLFSIPFVWQLIKPNRRLNFGLGVIFVCLSSYLILAYLSDVVDITHFSKQSKRFLFIGGLFVLTNFIMSLWIIRNSLTRRF